MDDPILAREAALESALRGPQAEQAAAGLEAAREHMKTGYAGKNPGFGLVQALGRDGDGWNFLFAVTDGTRSALITARISGTDKATVEARDEDLIEWALGRLDSKAGAFPRDHRYEDLLAQDQPITL